jgi:hypothetical protein
MKTLARINLLALCGLAIAVLLTAQHTAYAQLECNRVGAAITTTGDIALTDTVQSIRLFRDGRGSTCTFTRPATTSAVSVNSDAYTFTNTTGGAACISVELNAVGCGVATNQISMAAYSPSYNPAAVTTNVIGDPGLSTGTNFFTTMTFSVPAGATYVIVVHTVNNGTTCGSYTFNQYIYNGCRAPGTDIANDGRADLTVFRPSASNSNWYALDLTSGLNSVQLGSTGDIPVPGDYDGDEATNAAVFRPSNGTWYTSSNPANNYGAKAFGMSGDIPVQGNWDRDDITDLGVFRPSNNTWYILRSSDSTLLQLTFGTTGDKPVPADYDGDNKTDFAVFTPSTGQWRVIGSFGNYGAFTTSQTFGQSGDIPVPADYDGDAKADLAVFRPSEGGWYIFRTSLTTGQVQFVQWGASGDMPAPADYDGDKKADQAVFRPSNSTWYILRSTAGATAAQFGQSGDQPVSAPNPNTNQ